jgi:2-iminobutanoate/2-iminopropanoate deaminase
MKEVVTTENSAKPAGPYSKAIVVGDLVFVAGQGPRNPHTNQISAEFEEQVRQVLENIKAILEAAGCTMNQVVRTDVFLSDLKFFSQMNGVYKTYFEEGSYPVRTTVGTALLNNIDVEISCIAHKQA